MQSYRFVCFFLKASEENKLCFYACSVFCLGLLITKPSLFVPENLEKKFHADSILEPYFTEMLMSPGAKRERLERFVAWMPETVKGFYNSSLYS